MVISPSIIIVVSGCALDDLIIRKGWKKEITHETMDKLLCEKPRLDEGDKKALNTFLRTTNLTYMCRMIHSVLFSIVMHMVGSRDYISNINHLCIYKIMVREKVNYLRSSSSTRCVFLEKNS